MKRVIAVFALLFWAIIGFAQNEGIEIVRERDFEGTALYGFMNGGSDLFLEYGFQDLNIREVKYQGTSYTIEIYTMDTPKNAFGIYSIHIFKPLRVDSILAGKGFDCLSKYQLQAAYRDRYISIVFNSGSEAAPGAESLLKDIVASIDAESHAGYMVFPTEVNNLTRPFSGRLQYARGELGLSNADEEALPIYQEIGKEYGLWLFSASGEKTEYIKDADF